MGHYLWDMLGYLVRIEAYTDHATRHIWGWGDTIGQTSEQKNHTRLFGAEGIIIESEIDTELCVRRVGLSINREPCLRWYDLGDVTLLHRVDVADIERIYSDISEVA